jgi:serine/threonine protein kinase
MGCMSDLAGESVCVECGWQDGAELDSPLQLPLRTVLLGQYLIGRALGHGGFGIVYLGWDLNLELKVAIKEYLPGDYATRSPDGATVTPYSGDARDCFDYGLAKFLEEGRAIARFNDHPGIVPVLNFFKANGTGYLVMSYIPGRTLKEHLIARGGRLAYAETLAIAMPVMDTLRAVHKVGLLHRDISPDNIYISNSRQVKLLDFGAARIALGDKSKSLSVILKAGYAPKEQYQTKGRQGPWTDVYALGATMYRSMTGEVPPESLDRNERDEMATPRSLGVDIPIECEGVLLRALAVDPATRFQTVEAFQQAIVAVTGPPRDDQRDQRVVLDDTELSDDHADDRRRSHDNRPAPAFSSLDEFVRWIASWAMPIVKPINSVGVRFGVRPAPIDQARLIGPAIVASALVGTLGAWTAVWWMGLASMFGGMLAPVASIAGLLGLAGNLLLLVSAYLSAKRDARGPEIGCASASALIAIACAGFVSSLMNYAPVAGLAFAWQAAQVQFGGGLITASAALVTIIVLYTRRRA